MSREIGLGWEDEFVSLAKRRGLAAFRVYGQMPHDAVVSGLKIQCKTKEFHEQGRVRIAKGQHKYRTGDWDILALRFTGTLYLMPEHLLRMPGGTYKTVIKPVEFRRYIDAWSLFDGHEFQQDEQMLFQIH